MTATKRVCITMTETLTYKRVLDVPADDVDSYLYPECDSELLTLFEQVPAESATGLVMSAEVVSDQTPVTLVNDTLAKQA